MQASYVNAASCTVAGDQTAAFVAGVRVQADCGTDGLRYGTVAAAAYASGTGWTTVTIAPDAAPLTANLAGVLHGNDVPASLCHHGHAGPADGGTVAHGALSGAGSNSHAAIDAFLASKAASAGLASLNEAGKVVQDPASATASPAAAKIPVADAGGKLDVWITDAATNAKGKVQLATTTETAAGTLATKVVTPAGLAASAKGLIATNTTIYVATTGNDTTGDGSSGAPFASIAQALYAIRNKLIAAGVTVTIQLANGTYTIPSSINIDHTDSDKIQILGNTSAETTVAIAAIDTTAKTITVAGDYTASLLVGDIFGLAGSATSGLNGGYVASDVTYSGGNTVITCSDETIASPTVGDGSIVIKPCNRVQLVFNNCSGFLISKSIKTLSGLRVDCTSQGINNGITQSYALSTTLSKVIVYNFYQGILANNGSNMKLYNIISKKMSSSCVFIDANSMGYFSTLSFLDSANIGLRVSMSRAYASSTAVVMRNCTTTHSPAVNTFGNGGAYILS